MKVIFSSKLKSILKDDQARRDLRIAIDGDLNHKIKLGEKTYSVSFDGNPSSSIEGNCNVHKTRS